MGAGETNARLYPAYVACLNGFFWFPIFFLYFTERVGLSSALALESLYYAAVVAAEVPSGWASDRLGRRLALRLSMLFLTVSYVLFVLADSFALLAVAQGFMALGYAFNSGTDTAFHYDSLVAAGLEESYPEREERIARLSFATVGLAAVVGGLAGTFDLRLAYVLAACASIVGLAVTFRFHDLPPAEQAAERIDRQIVVCVRLWSDPVLRWTAAFFVMLTVVVHIPYQLYQPYLDLLSVDVVAPTPVLTGLHAAAAMLVAALLSGRSVSVARRVGFGRLVLWSGALGVGIIAAMSLVLHPIVALLLVFRSAPRALTLAAMNAVVVPRVPRHLRASYLSIQSLAGRLSFSALLAVLAALGSTDGATYAELATMSLASVCLLAAMWVGLYLTRRMVDGESRA